MVNFATEPLMLAAATDKQDAVKVLLKSGADKDARDQNGMTALMLAEKLNQAKVLKLLK